MTTVIIEDAQTDDVDVVIVGSGPCGGAYARELHAMAPAARVLVVEVGPQISDPAGSHVKNIADDTLRQQAQLASQGPAPSQVVNGSQPTPGRAGTFLVDGHPDQAALAKGFTQRDLCHPSLCDSVRCRHECDRTNGMMLPAKL